MKRMPWIVMALLYFVAAPIVAYAAATFTLAGTAGVRPVPTGVTQAKFPPPLVARDPLVTPILVFDAVRRVETAAAAPAPPVVTWPTWRCAVRADAIVRVEQGTDEQAEYLRVYLAAPATDNGLVLEGQVVLVRGDLDTVLGVLAQTTGTRRVDVTFAEAR
jgi:hypothetical protein